jgi:DNA polymerase
LGKVCGDYGENTRVIFIGEAPGEEEDKLGHPFVGKSGQLLRDWIADTGLKADEYSILNIVKCRPPNNRKPIESECSTCGVWLKQQISELGAKKLVIVGSTAAEFFLGKLPIYDGRILKYVGRVFNVTGYQMFILPHPAFVLRHGGNYPVPVDELRAFVWREYKDD